MTWHWLSRESDHERCCVAEYHCDLSDLGGALVTISTPPQQCTVDELALKFAQPLLDAIICENYFKDYLEFFAESCIRGDEIKGPRFSELN